MAKRTGSEILADTLKINGAEIVYHVPGESFLSVLDAMAVRHEDIRQVSCRHEAGSAIMAEAYGKLTGRPGIAMVTRSPGATNAASGVHTAFQDSSPMILFVGQVKRSILEREAFMSYDFRQMFAPMAKWVAQIDDAARIPEFIQRAYHTAMTGRMGPVVLILPEDMLEEECEVEDGRPYVRASGGAPTHSDIDRLYGMLAEARHPLMIVGGSGWTQSARDNVQKFADANNVPVATAFRRRDIIDNGHKCYVGEIGIGSNPALLAHIRQADFVIMCNDALSDVNTIGAGYMEGFTLFSIPTPKQKIVHVCGGVEELNRVFQVDLAILAENEHFTEALARHAPVLHRSWDRWTQDLKDTYNAECASAGCPGDIDLPGIMKWLRTRLPANAIVTNGVGAYATWSQRYFSHSELHTQLGPISGSMGYGLPAAISAKLCYPDRVVINFVGDGCYQMTGEELATAVQYGVGVIVILFNNNMYGTIRIHEENKLDGRVNGTQLTNPNFYALGKAYGAHSERVSRTEEFEPAFERALTSGRPAIIEMIIDQEAIHTRYSLTDLRNRRRR
ncbi:thiamine pyrophosphate-binding protein [Microvirga brassicacearum]|uniref:Thiamine pyrophosphate-binding protein n=1 Tax=Microvirga brassicacearum TaxID=2580413 RepID=A0A5N3PBT5_9HYPH|nr:thiamine pyrophosphate-binding protein [Microvirga brassicacearum]KAB0267217.1 thiamine pyrophosphate-binding protein [Microvirga brassicacearum]